MHYALRNGIRTDRDRSRWISFRRSCVSCLVLAIITLYPFDPHRSSSSLSRTCSLSFYFSLSLSLFFSLVPRIQQSRMVKTTDGTPDQVSRSDARKSLLFRVVGEYVRSVRFSMNDNLERNCVEICLRCYELSKIYFYIFFVTSRYLVPKSFSRFIYVQIIHVQISTYFYCLIRNVFAV